MNRILFSICLACAITLLGCGKTTGPEPVVQQNSDQSSTESEPLSASNEAVEETAEAAAAEAATAETESPDESSDIVYGDKFPEVLAVKASRFNKGWRFDVTLSSAYDTPQRYADAWRVLDDKGNELGIRILGHDHAGEQPFTRSTVIELPENISTVFVEGRDQANGWSGQRFEFKMP